MANINLNNSLYSNVDAKHNKNKILMSNRRLDKLFRNNKNFCNKNYFM